MKKLTLLALCTALAATAAQADNYYIGGAIGKSKMELGTTTGVQVVDDKNTVFKVFGGYRYNEHLAVELSYADLGEITVKNNTASAKGDTDSIGVSLMGIAPVNEAFEVFGKLGVHRWNTDASATNGTITVSQDGSDTDIFYGIGAQYHIENISLRMEVERYRGDDDEADLVTLGLSVRF